MFDIGRLHIPREYRVSLAAIALGLAVFSVALCSAFGGEAETPVLGTPATSAGAGD